MSVCRGWGLAVVSGLCVSLLGASAVMAQTFVKFTDPDGDASIHRVDLGNDGPLTAESLASPHDLLDVTLMPWNSPNPKDNPFAGSAVAWQCGSVHFFRLDMRIKGFANPPGDLGSWSGVPDPLQYGMNPLYGFIEIDMDNNANTGGELGDAAESRYLANVGRFGQTPIGMADRVAKSACDFDDNCQTGPEYERSGADFTLAFCGCGCFEIEDGDTNWNGIFDSGEVWITKGLVFQRAGGFRLASAAKSKCSQPIGYYNPEAEVRWEYLSGQDVTLISLVFPLDQEGAALMEEDDPEALNSNSGDQASVHEGLWEVANYSGTVTDPCTIKLTQGWWAYKNKAMCQFPLNPLLWKVRAIIGTGYATVGLGEPAYVWTDTGFGEVEGDLNGDGLVNAADDAIVQGAIAALDGQSLCPPDADGTVNGAVVLGGFASQFHLADLDYDGVIGVASEPCYPDCDASGGLDIDDFICFQTIYALGLPEADCDGSGGLDINDFVCFQTYYAIGC